MIKITLKAVKFKYLTLTIKLPKELIFITSEELRLKYQIVTPKQREILFARETKTFYYLSWL